MCKSQKKMSCQVVQYSSHKVFFNHISSILCIREEHKEMNDSIY